MSLNTVQKVNHKLYALKLKSTILQASKYDFVSSKKQKIDEHEYKKLLVDEY